jgi:acetolactate synthase-1/2/3 large subunit
VAGVAQATGAAYVRMDSDADIESSLDTAFAAAANHRPVLVDVSVDYSRRTRFTDGIVKTNLERFDLGTKARLVGRALWRRISG